MPSVAISMDLSILSGEQLSEFYTLIASSRPYFTRCLQQLMLKHLHALEIFTEIFSTYHNDVSKSAYAFMQSSNVV